MLASSISSFSHATASILYFCCSADNNDDGLVDYECNGVGIFFFGSIYIIDATLGLQYLGGGGIAATDSTITMTDCEISGNTVRFTIS